MHRAEHSIEFQVVFLQYVLGKERSFSIVPILVGSFQDLLERGIDPIDDPEVRRFVEALRLAEAASGKNVAYIGGIDLCHVGPEFGDPAPVDSQTSGDGSPLRQRDARARGGGRPGELVPDGGQRGQPLAGLRPGRHLHDAPRHRPGAGPPAQVRPGPRRSADLLRELRQHGLSLPGNSPGSEQIPTNGNTNA